MPATDTPARPALSPLSRPRSPGVGWATSWSAWLMPVLVLALALAVAGHLYGLFLGVSRQLWYSSTHDRNAHYLYSLRLATDVQQGRVFRLLEDVNSARTWPPLHGLLAAAVLLVGGLDYRLAVLPSLAGWLLTVLFGFLVARRAVPRGAGSWNGELAGLAASLFILASPAYRAYATDIMLESLGAGLSLVVLYSYLLTVQEDRAKLWPGRCLGLALTALFLHKYNYWLLVLLALAAAEATSHPRAAWDLVRTTVSGIDWSRWGRSQLRAPLNYVLVLFVLLSAAVGLRGDRPLVFQGQAVSVYPPHNLIHVAYVVFFLRLVSWWRSSGRAWSRQLNGRVRQVVLWHLWPMAVYFLMPKHLSYFAWFLSPNNAHPFQKFGILAGITEYSWWVVTDYHLTLWWALLAGGLVLVGLLSARRLAPGGAVVFWLLVIGAVLTVLHPNHKARCMHSWLATTWVAAGIGLAGLVHGRLTSSWPGVRPWLAGAAVAGLGWTALPQVWQLGHAVEGGPHLQCGCVLDLTDSYLADLAGSEQATVLATVPVKPLTQWTFLERQGQLDALEDNWYGFGAAGADNRQGFLNWLRTTHCDTLVFLDGVPDRRVWEEVAEQDLHAELRDLLLTQHVFHLVKEQDFPQYACRVLVWRR